MNELSIVWPWNINLEKQLSGAAVMFDVNAASTNIAAILGVAEELYVTDAQGLSTALRMLPDAILVGESKDPAIATKFQVSNNASYVNRAVSEGVFTGRRVVLLTTNGTHVLLRLNKVRAAPVLSASYANLTTIATWLRANVREGNITMVPAGGHEAEFENDRELVEDRICAEALIGLIEGREVDLEKCFAESRVGIDRQYVKYDGRWSTKSEDLDLIFQKEDRYKVVPLCVRTGNGLVSVIDALKVGSSGFPNF